MAILNMPVQSSVQLPWFGQQDIKAEGKGMVRVCVDKDHADSFRSTRLFTQKILPDGFMPKIALK